MSADEPAAKQRKSNPVAFRKVVRLYHVICCRHLNLLLKMSAAFSPVTNVQDLTCEALLPICLRNLWLNCLVVSQESNPQKLRELAADIGETCKMFALPLATMVIGWIMVIRRYTC